MAWVFQGLLKITITINLMHELLSSIMSKILLTISYHKKTDPS
jgi:hypothetical protein